jgi:hypothetical protein
MKDINEEDYRGSHRAPNIDNVVRKTESALKYCEINGLIYKKRDIGVLTDLEINDLYTNGYIKFLPRYEIKYKEKFCLFKNN